MVWTWETPWARAAKKGKFIQVTETSNSEVGQENLLSQFQSWELNLATDVPGECLYSAHGQSVFPVQLIFNCLCSCNKKGWEKSSPEQLTAGWLAHSLGKWENGKCSHLLEVFLETLFFFTKNLLSCWVFTHTKQEKRAYLKKKNHKKQKANNQTKIPKHITNLSLFARQKYFFHRYPQKCSVTWVPYGLSELMSLSSLLLFSKRSTYSPSFKEISQQILHQ